MTRHKKLLTCAAVAVLTLALTACGGNADNAGNNGNAGNAGNTENTGNTGNTENDGNAANPSSPNNQNDTGTGNTGTNQPDSENTSKTKQGTGTWVGLEDSHSAEIMMNGVPESFQLSESVQGTADGLNPDDAVNFEYEEKAIEGEASLKQKTITKLGKTG
ncbi:hypothetical protein DFP94_10184 [Fontibacillus phaseoli]|uniref:Lipoprotein n=1 Tax=Fontibacillus phaseoli TaxID=1416533 RepID=A0A369BSC9_9BACL|nr:hypothetical protein [Fontibacillus phaseoli]RCX22504.1 hypothetical protein DFP94_10184 [Fontibacillus phaseoli]